jgi:four helix bundle protein
MVATINRFEDLECWMEARKLVEMVYRAITENKEFKMDYRLVGQLTGAAISVMNNIAEGWASQSNNEFIRFLTYSRRSCAESQNCLYVALDQHYISQQTFNNIYDQALKTVKIIDGLLRYLRSQRTKKSKTILTPIKPQTISTIITSLTI